MEKIDDVYNILNDLGLDDKEINSINNRNKFLTSTTEDDVNQVIDFFKIKCKLTKEDIASIIIDNPLLLSESKERFNILFGIYKKIGFTDSEYREYVTNFSKAFSINPKDLGQSILSLMDKGMKMEEIKEVIIKKPYTIL